MRKPAVIYVHPTFIKRLDRLLHFEGLYIEYILLDALIGNQIQSLNLKMASFGGDFKRLGGVIVLSWLSDSSEEVDDSDDSLEVLYAGMDAGELNEVSSCLVVMLVMILRGKTKTRSILLYQGLLLVL